VCEPELTAAFEPRPLGSEPEWFPPRSPLALERPAENWVLTHLWLPWNYNRSSWYPVEEGDSVYFRLRFLAGVDFDRAEEAMALVFVEGRPVEALVGGERVQQIEAPLVDGVGETPVIVLPPETLGPGLNQVNVITIYRLNGRNGPTSFRPGGVFTVANGSTEPQPYSPDTPGLEEAVHREDEPARVYRVSSENPELGEQSFPYANRNHGIVEDSLSLVLRMRSTSPWATSCPGAEERMAVVAVLDGEPTSMGDLDDIFVTLGAEEERVHRFERPLWSDGEEHLWGLFAFTGFGRPARQHHGGPAPWQNPQEMLTSIQWAAD
jgi:hypothetical protein